ncbi:YbiU family protein [Escherichia coli]
MYPIYWSQAQMQARQSEEMANAQSFLNRLWTFESDGKQWFNPDVSVIYPDRIRRRPPGTDLQRSWSAYRLRGTGTLAASSVSARFRQRL